MKREGLRWVIPLSVAGFFSGIAVSSVSARYSPGNLALVVALYLLLAFTLSGGAGFLMRFGRVPGWAGAFVLTFAAVCHLREQLFFPESVSAALALAALLSVLFLLMEERLVASGSLLPGWRGFVLPAVAFVVLWIGAYEASPTLRWHLLQHNTLLGTPAYHLLDETVLSRREALFEAHRVTSPPLSERRPAAGVEADFRPHLVFVMLDTLRADVLAGGGEADLMPRLERFFAESYRFADVIANSTWTRPSVASFFTGLLPEEHGARLGHDPVAGSDPLAASQVTLAEVLRGRGYSTAAFVTNLPAVGRPAGFDQGFDVFHEYPDLPYARAEKVKRHLDRWLSGLEEGASWFLYLHLLDPHEPYHAGGEPKGGRPREFWAAYRKELSYLDRELAEMLAAVERELPGPTFFFVTSDHGEEFYEHERFGHGFTLYDEVLRIPAALRTGGGSGDLAARLEARDFFDLLLAVTASRDFSVEEWARRHSRGRRYASLYHSTKGRHAFRPYLRRMCQRAVEGEGYKLIWSAYGDTYELYDLERDPGEQRNLAAEQPERVARMAAAFDSHVAYWSFPAPIEVGDGTREKLRALGYLD
jgi:arylsulfatase A-like enzyme